jgi:hypothetical protein
MRLETIWGTAVENIPLLKVQIAQIILAIQNSLTF